MADAFGDDTGKPSQIDPAHGCLSVFASVPAQRMGIQIAADWSTNRAVNELALKLMNRAGFTLQPTRSPSGEAIQSEAILLSSRQ